MTDDEKVNTNDERVNISLTMQQLALLREALLRQRDGLRSVVEPFGLVTTWEVAGRLDDVFGLVTEARCDLKRRHPKYNPAGDSECSGYATDEEMDRWALEHPGAPVPDHAD